MKSFLGSHKPNSGCASHNPGTKILVPNRVVNIWRTTRPWIATWQFDSHELLGLSWSMNFHTVDGRRAVKAGSLDFLQAKFLQMSTAKAHLFVIDGLWLRRRSWFLNSWFADFEDGRR